MFLWQHFIGELTGLNWTGSSALRLCLLFSSKWTASGGRGSTTSASRSSSAFTRRREDSGASQPSTTWPRLPIGLCLELRNKVSTQPTRGSNGGTKPKTFQDAERLKKAKKNPNKGQFYCSILVKPTEKVSSFVFLRLFLCQFSADSIWARGLHCYCSTTFLHVYLGFLRIWRFEMFVCLFFMYKWMQL